MKTILFVNKFDPTVFTIANNLKARNDEVDIILSQDATYIATKNNPQDANLNQTIKAGIKIYLLDGDIKKRGIGKNLSDGTIAINYNQMVDLLAQDNQKIINL